MKFSKIAEQQAWDTVEKNTLAAHQGDLASPALLEWFEKQGIDPQQAIFPCIGEFDENTYSGTLISGDRHVFEYFVDLSEPDEGEFDDVTDELGPKDPSHPQSDAKDLITMSLIYLDDLHHQAA